MKNPRIVPILIVVCVVLAVALVLAFTIGRQPAQQASAKIYKIGIAQLGTHPALDAALEGFIDQMKEEGFIEGENVDYIIRNAAFEAANYATISQYFVSANVDLIFSIATPMTQACASAVQGLSLIHI